MPLLKRKAFEKVKVPEYLRDDEEVFYCEVTNEIFRDYEEFCERIILVNSMVWSCSMTGRNNLTYAEALQSEENARRSLRDFPQEMKLPILYLATKTRRCNFTEMAEDVFNFAKDRYFVGEKLDASFTENNWVESSVLQVLAPTDEQINSYKSDSKLPDAFMPPACLFRYEVEQVVSEEQDSTQVLILEASQVRRKKSQFTREKNRLFLKQFVEQTKEGIWKIKDTIVEQYSIRKITFDQIFDGPLPDFSTSKKLIKKQETLMKYLTKTNTLQNKPKMVKPELTAEEKLKAQKFAEEMKRLSIELKQKTAEQKQNALKMKIEEKQKKKEESLKLNALIKEWNKQKEDLELEDHKLLPIPTPVRTKIPDEHFGDALMIVEFVHSFSDVISPKKFFPGGLTLELMERALLEKEVAGPFTDLIQMLLTALFNMQSEEAAESNNNSTKVEMEDNRSGGVSLDEAVNLATAASSWCSRHQGVNLPRMPLDSLTVTEVLRLHLLGSGSRMTDSAARWQYQQRGGYTSQDDPGLALRMEEPHVIRALAVQHIAQLSVGEKLKIAMCLVNQILTFAAVRDVVEDRMEKVRQARNDIKLLQTAERKRESEASALKFKLKRDAKLKKDENPKMKLTIDTELEVALEKVKKDQEKKQKEYNAKLQETIQNANSNLLILGLDRAYRKYIYSDAIPALFVEHDEQYPGRCLDRPVIPNPELADAQPEDTVKYIKTLYNETNGSDKENEHKQDAKPKKNGVLKSPVKREPLDLSIVQEMYMCTANGAECIVHSNSVDKVKWSFFYKPEDLEALIANLNKRGYREGELKQVLEQAKEYLADRISNCPVEKISDIKVEQSVVNNRLSRNKGGKNRYEKANLNFEPGTDVNYVLEMTLKDYILEMEQQMFSGGLGVLCVQDRLKWRNCLKNGNYNLDCLKFTPSNGALEKIKNDEKLQNGSRCSTPENSAVNGCVDPSRYLVSSKTKEEDVQLSEKQQQTVLGLTTALYTIAHSIDRKFLRSPLGSADKKRGSKDTPGVKSDMLDKWSESLMCSVGLPQVLFHYAGLDACVLWGKSALNARCVVCRRCTDDDQLLLCDGCNRGQHLYCFEPKMTSVPSGDWFCERCRPKELPQRSTRSRRIFTEAASDDEENEEGDGDESSGQEEDDRQSDNDESSAEQNGDSGTESEEAESEEDAAKPKEVCETCGEGGRMMCCDGCPLMYHPECLQPPLKRIPRGTWFCISCKEKQGKQDNKAKRAKRANARGAEKEVREQHDSSDFSSESCSPTADSDGTAAGGWGRRCARQARHKIHGFVRSLRRTSHGSSSEDEAEENGNSTSSSSSATETQGTAGRRSRRGNESADLPLHNAALQEILSDVLKHKACWPFSQPVQKRDVPDYFEVISHPMDFGTIKYKLNMGNYQYDAELMADAMLVFENCNTYNDSDAPVYKAGVKLLKYFKQRCREMGIALPKVEDNGLHDDADALNSNDSSLDDDDDTSPPPLKKSRTSR